MSAFYYDHHPVNSQFQKHIPNFDDPTDPASIDWVECDKILSNHPQNSPTQTTAPVPSPPNSLNSHSGNNQQYFINPLIPSPESSESSHSSMPPNNNSSYIPVKSEDDILNQSYNTPLNGLDDTEVKRKAQNRAAQRAFRERKEQRVRELEIKLAEAEEIVQKLTKDNNRLQQENTVLKTENQVLRSSQSANGNNNNNMNNHPAPQHATFPSHQFYASLLEGHEDPNTMTDDNSVQPSYIVYERRHGETMLGAGTVWQMLMEDPVMSAEDVDINFVVQYIKDKACCDGYGPVYPLREVHEGIRLAKEAKVKKLQPK